VDTESLWGQVFYVRENGSIILNSISAGLEISYLILQRLFNEFHEVVFTLRNALPYTVHSESHCALRLQYVDLVVSIAFAVEECSCFILFSC
jgi:hypothetical protein